MSTQPSTLFELMVHPEPWVPDEEPGASVHVVATDAPKLSKKPVFLGEIDGKEYYLDVDPGKPTSPNPNYNQVIWRVPDIRDAIRAEAGKVIVAADYSQIEIRIMAFLSKDPWLIAAINSGKDMHTFMATDIFGVKLGFTYDEMAAAIADKSHPRNKEFAKLRNKTKRCSFGIPYGISPVGLAFLIDDTEEAAAELMELYFGKAKVLKKWLADQAIAAVKNGYTSSLYGRLRFYEIPHPDDPKAKELLQQIGRWSGNHPIQSSNADMLKLAMTRLYSELRDRVLTKAAKWGAQLLFVVHDEIVTMCDAQYGEQMKALLEECMDWAYEELIGAENVFHKATAVVADVWSKA